MTNCGMAFDGETNRRPWMWRTHSIGRRLGLLLNTRVLPLLTPTSKHALIRPPFTLSTMISTTSCRNQWLSKSGIKQTKLLFMHDHRGFIGLPVLLAILLGIVVLGGGAYYVQQQSASKTESSNLDNLQELQADTVASNLTPKPQIYSPSSTAENNAKWTTYRNGKFSFELQYPSDMTVREQTGSDPRTGENWVRVMFRNEQDDFGLTFFAGVQFVGGPGEGYSSFQ